MKSKLTLERVSVAMLEFVAPIGVIYSIVVAIIFAGYPPTYLLIPGLIIIGIGVLPLLIIAFFLLTFPIWYPIETIIRKVGKM